MTDDQFQEFMAVLTSISESLRIISNEIEEAAYRAENNDEEG